MVFRQLIPSREFHSLLSYTLIQGQQQIKHVTATPAEQNDVLSERDISSLHESVGNRIS